MQIELVCPQCRAPHIPTKADFLKPPSVYRLCPTCRDRIVAENVVPTNLRDMSSAPLEAA